MPHNGETRKQVSVALSEVQTNWCNQQARKRGISTAEFIRRLIDGMMLGDNTMSRGVDWQPASPPESPRGKSQYGEVIRSAGVEIRAAPMPPDHPRHAEYVAALRRGDVEAAEKIRRG